MKAFFALISGLILNMPSSPALAQKIDATGRYLPFPGITIVSYVESSELATWETFYQELTKIPEFTNYFAILPVKSFHMTTTNLYTQSQFSSKEAWSGFTSTHLKLFEQIHHHLESNAFNPAVKVREVILTSVIMLTLNVSKTETGIIHKTAERFSVQDFIPPVFHITIAYQYKPLTKATGLAIQSAVQAIVSDLFIKPGRSLLLQKPQLTYFNDMSAFIPWDAGMNPFLTP